MKTRSKMAPWLSLLLGLLLDLVLGLGCSGDTGFEGEDAGVDGGRTLLALGAFCEDDDDCESDLCSQAVLQCVPNGCAVVGEACDEATFCTARACGRVCEAPLPRGGECLMFTDEGGSCVGVQATCQAELVCGVAGFQREFGSGACVPAVDRALGEPCGEARDACAVGLVCDDISDRCVDAPTPTP